MYTILAFLSATGLKQKFGKTENGRVVPSETVPIHLNWSSEMRDVCY